MLSNSLLSPVRPLQLGTRLFSPVVRGLWEKATLARHDGVSLVDHSPNEDLRDDFVRRMVEALELVRLEDPRRYKRVLMHFCFIVQHDLPFRSAQYWRWPSACLVDYSKFGFPKHPQAALVLLAATLVHEATHAMLFHRGVPYISRTRLDVERICYLEETRFVGRINRNLEAGWMERRFKPKELEEALRRYRWRRLTLLWSFYRSASMSGPEPGPL
jgi:hypothetical protein